jgi:hypothetical protein
MRSLEGAIAHQKVDVDNEAFEQKNGSMIQKPYC